MHGYYFEVTDSTPPEIISLKPSNDGEDVDSHHIQSTAAGGGIRFEFDEYVTVGSGNITLTPFGGNNENVEFDIPVPSSQMSCSNTVCTLIPEKFLDDRGNKIWRVAMPTGVIEVRVVDDLYMFN